MEQIGRRVLGSETFWTGLYLLLALGACIAIAGGLLVLPAPLVVAGILALLASVAILRNPYWGILLFLSLVYLHPESQFPKLAALRLPLLLSSLTLFAWLLQLLLKRETFRWRTEIGWMALMAFGLVLSSLKLSKSSETLMALIEGAKLLIAVFLIQQLVNSEQRAHFAMRLLLVFGVGLALLSIKGWITGTSVFVEKHGGLRAMVNAGEFDDPNDLAAALVPMVPLALVLLTQAKSWLSRCWGGIALGGLLLSIYLTNSRGGMLALGMALFVYLIYRVGWGKGLLLGALAVGLMFALGPDRFSADKLSAADDSAMGRILAWEAGLRMFQHSPVLGAGFDQFKELFPLVPAAHNSFVQGLAEGGFIIALAWVGLNYWAVLTLVRLWRLRQDEKREGRELNSSTLPYTVALLAGLLGSLVADMFLSHTFDLIQKIPVAIAAGLGTLGGEALQPSLRRDWYHVAIAIGLTLFGILATYGVVAVAK